MINKLHFNTLVGAIILVLGSSPAMAESTYGYNSAGTVLVPVPAYPDRVMSTLFLKDFP